MRQLVLLALPIFVAACSDDGGEPAAAGEATAAGGASSDIVATAGPVAPDSAAPPSLDAPPAGWRQEPDMRGVQYVGRVPADGSGLHVEGWRNDGGFYISDDLHSVSVYSTQDRIAFSAEAFRHRERDGVAAWTIADFWSWPADREESGLGLLCGYGPDPARWSGGDTHVIAIVQWSAVPRDVENHHEGVVAAASVDLRAGAITPVTTDDVWCHQELP